MLNIAVWGIGNHAIRNAIPAIAEADGMRLAGFLSRDQSKSSKLAADYGCASWKSPHEMLADLEVDCVYVASPVGLHFEQAMSALSAGKHVFCEKSLTDDHGRTVKLFELAKAKNLMLFECFMYLYHRQFKKLKELLSAGEIGELFNITARFGFPHLAKDNIRYDKELGGGACLDAGVYPLSAILALGEGKLLSVAGSKWQPPGYDVDIRGAACLQFSHGMIGHACWGMGLEYRNEIEIWGSHGFVKVERAYSKPSDLESKIIVIKNGNQQEIHTGADDHFIKMFESFAHSYGDQKTASERRELSESVADIASRLSMIT